MYYSSFCNNLKRLILFSIFFSYIHYFYQFFVGSQKLLKKNANKHEKSMKRIVVPVQTYLFANFIYDI